MQHFKYMQLAFLQQLMMLFKLQVLEQHLMDIIESHLLDQRHLFLLVEQQVIQQLPVISMELFLDHHLLLQQLLRMVLLP